MKQEEAVLAEISACPEDEQVRLVYADWLEERGDERAELIRIMEEMAALPVYSDRHAQLRPRRDELRARTDKTWLERMGYLPTHRPMFTRLPERRIERWRLVEEFIGTWYHPLQPKDGATEDELQAAEKRLGFRLPAALREWHAIAGKRKDVWSKQDSLVLLPQLQLGQTWQGTDVRNLICYAENQGCEVWGIRVQDLELEDPPVYCFIEPARVSPSLSTFAIQVLLYEVKGSANRNITANGRVAPGDPAYREVKRNYRRCRLPERYWVGFDSIRLYEGRDIIIETHERSDEWIYVTARTEAAYMQLSQAMRGQLERYDY